ncbi:MAG: hypothetical protein H0W96_05405 [Solirubrobacterales bacterium]|nr:hypothetical protein [Solirubrobacterales bacterium]
MSGVRVPPPASGKPCNAGLRALYRLPDGRRVHKTIGPAWTQRGRPAAGHFTKRTAEAWLRDVLDDARRGTLAGMTQTGVTFAQACEDYLAHKDADRRLKPTTLRDYGSIIEAHLVPAFGDLAVEDLTTDIVEDWKLTLRMSNTTIKILTSSTSPASVWTFASRCATTSRRALARCERPRTFPDSRVAVCVRRRFCTIAIAAAAWS